VVLTFHLPSNLFAAPRSGRQTVYGMNCNFLPSNFLRPEGACGSSSLELAVYDLKSIFCWRRAFLETDLWKVRKGERRGDVNKNLKLFFFGKEALHLLSQRAPLCRVANIEATNTQKRTNRMIFGNASIFRSRVQASNLKPKIV